jgi:hypothetical protein
MTVQLHLTFILDYYYAVHLFMNRCCIGRWHTVSVLRGA